MSQPVNPAAPTKRVVVFHGLPEGQYAESYAQRFAALGIEVIAAFSAPFGHRKAPSGADLALLCTWQMSHANGALAKRIATEAGLRLVTLPTNASGWGHILGIDRPLDPPLPPAPGQEAAGPHTSLAAAYSAYTTELYRLTGSLEVAEFEREEQAQLAAAAMAETAEWKSTREQLEARLAAAEAQVEENRDIRSNLQTLRAIHAELMTLQKDTEEHAVETKAERDAALADLEKAKSAILGLQAELAKAQAETERADTFSATNVNARQEAERAKRVAEAQVTTLQADLAAAKRAGPQPKAGAGATHLPADTLADADAVGRMVRRGLMPLDEGFAALLKLLKGESA